MALCRQLGDVQLLDAGSCSRLSRMAGKRRRAAEASLPASGDPAADDALRAEDVHCDDSEESPGEVEGGNDEFLWDLVSDDDVRRGGDEAHMTKKPPVLQQWYPSLVADGSRGFVFGSLRLTWSCCVALSRRVAQVVARMMALPNLLLAVGVTVPSNPVDAVELWDLYERTSSLYSRISERLDKIQVGSHRLYALTMGRQLPRSSWARSPRRGRCGVRC